MHYSLLRKTFRRNLEDFYEPQLASFLLCFNFIYIFYAYSLTHLVCFRFLDPAADVQSLQSAVNSRSHLLQSTPTDFNSMGGALSSDAVEVTIDRKQLERWEYFMLLLLIAWLNGLSNGVLPSIQSYSCLPYSIEVSRMNLCYD